MHTASPQFQGETTRAVGENGKIWDRVALCDTDRVCVCVGVFDEVRDGVREGVGEADGHLGKGHSCIGGCAGAPVFNVPQHVDLPECNAQVCSHPPVSLVTPPKLSGGTVLFASGTPQHVTVSFCRLAQA
jgi:hypothetical protein